MLTWNALAYVAGEPFNNSWSYKFLTSVLVKIVSC